MKHAKTLLILRTNKSRNLCNALVLHFAQKSAP